MTRSTQKGISRGDAFNKSVRAKAHKEGLLFSEALTKLNATPAIRTPNVTQTDRRNPGRNGQQWNGGNFISAPEVDDGALEVQDEDVYDYKVDFSQTHDTPSRETDMTVSILDIARPAKRKGPAKDFEVVQKVRGVIALEDEPELDDDMWEAIYDEETQDSRTLYATILRSVYDT